jgi:predicted glycosyl hydrolase (DUF1957 family)
MNKLSYLEYITLSSLIKKIDSFGQKNLKSSSYEENSVRQLFLSMWSKELISNDVVHLDKQISENELKEIKKLLNSEGELPLITLERNIEEQVASGIIQKDQHNLRLLYL